MSFYYFVLVSTILLALVLWWIVRSPWGRAFAALRDNPIRAESLGVNIMAYTLLAFAIGAAFAGIAGAIGAFGVLLAFGSRGTPVVVMSLVFAGAPLINALLGSLLHPPRDGWGQVNPLFFAGILLAVAGGYMVARYNPANLAPPKKAPSQAAQSASAKV